MVYKLRFITWHESLQFLFRNVNENRAQLSCNIRQCTFRHVPLVKILISLHICTVWFESSLGIFLIAKDARFLHADSEDWSDCKDVRLFWFLVGCPCQKMSILLVYMTVFTLNSVKPDQMCRICHLTPGLHSCSFKTQIVKGSCSNSRTHRYGKDKMCQHS